MGAPWSEEDNVSEDFTICGADHPDENMYGFLPCPKCGSKYRCEFQAKPGVAQCDDCGHHQPCIHFDDLCVACKKAKYVKIASDGDKLCQKCKQKPKCNGCKKRVGRVICSTVEPKKAYCGPCTRRRGG